MNEIQKYYLYKMEEHAKDLDGVEFEIAMLQYINEGWRIRIECDQRMMRRAVKGGIITALIIGAIGLPILHYYGKFI